jgi:hypothetical protein
MNSRESAARSSNSAQGPWSRSSDTLQVHALGACHLGVSRVAVHTDLPQVHASQCRSQLDLIVEPVRRYPTVSPSAW